MKFPSFSSLKDIVSPASWSPKAQHVGSLAAAAVLLVCMSSPELAAQDKESDNVDSYKPSFSLYAGGDYVRSDYQLWGKHYGVGYTLPTDDRYCSVFLFTLGMQDLHSFGDPYGREEDQRNVQAGVQRRPQIPQVERFLPTQLQPVIGAQLTAPLFVDHDQSDIAKLQPLLSLQSWVGWQLPVSTWKTTGELYLLLVLNLGDTDHNTQGDHHPLSGGLQLWARLSL